jgi:hypothetical protein
VRPVRTPLLAALIFFVLSLLIGFHPALRPSGGTQPAAHRALEVRSVSDLIFLLGYEAEIKFTSIDRIPRWATETAQTEHFVYYHAKGDNPIQASLEAQERHYQFFQQVLGIEMPQQLHFVKYPDRSGFAGGLGGRGYIHSKWWFHPHEAVHTFLPSRNRFLHEGVAEAFGTTFYQFWGDFFIPKAEMNVQRLYEATDRLLSVTDTDRRVACSFVRWLFHRHGPEKLVTALREAYPGGSRTRDVIARVYGVPFGDLAAQWQRDQQWLSTQPPPKGFFLHPPWEREARVPVSVPSTGGP